VSSLGEGISRAHLAGIIEAAMDAIVTVDEQQCVVAFNPAAERMFGHAREAVLGRALSLLLPERFHAGHADHVQSFGVSGVTGRSMGALGVLTARRADGTEFPIEAAISQAETDGRRLFTAVVRDISERIAAEQARARALEALRESEERFRLLVDGVQDYAIFMLDPEGRIVSWNSGAERTMGYAADEAIGQHVSLFYPPEDVASGWLQRELSAAASGRFDEEAQRVRKDGSRFWASVVTTALRDEQGGLRGYAKVTRDISERKRIEAGAGRLGRKAGARGRNLAALPAAHSAARRLPRPALQGVLPARARRGAGRR
jgi:PAS domain S-box-containing protein